MMMMMMTQVIILNLLHKNKIYKILKSSIYWITCHLTVKNDNIILCRRRCTYHKHLGFCTVQLKNRMLLLSQLVLEDRMLHDDTYVANERCADIKWMARSSTFCQFRCFPIGTILVRVVSTMMAMMMAHSAVNVWVNGEAFVFAMWLSVLGERKERAEKERWRKDK